MKQPLYLAAIVLAGTLSSMAQGVVNPNNDGSGVLIQIEDASGNLNGGIPVAIGTPATADGFIGAGPGQIAMELYAAPTGTSLQNLEASTPIWTGFNSLTTIPGFQGTVFPGNSFILPTQPGFDGTANVEFIFSGQATVNGTAIQAWSGVGVVEPAQPGSISPPPQIWGGPDGIPSMIFIVPEPSTIVLSGLGAAALLLFRRRRNF